MDKKSVDINNEYRKYIVKKMSKCLRKFGTIILNFFMLFIKKRIDGKNSPKYIIGDPNNLDINIEEKKEKAKPNLNK